MYDLFTTIIIIFLVIYSIIIKPYSVSMLKWIFTFSSLLLLPYSVNAFDYWQEFITPYTNFKYPRMYCSWANR